MTALLSPGFADMLGMLGAITILAGYGYQTLRRAAPDWLSSLLNLAGALLLSASLSVNYNLPALCLELAWAAIALVGLLRLTKVRA